MEQKQRRNALEWSDIFSEWRRSGKSQRGYCQGEGISISAFGYWYRKLERDGEEHPIVKISSLASLPSVGGSGLTARAGGVLVDLTGGESEDLLIRVFRALKAVL
jgi:hypothetical protein